LGLFFIFFITAKLDKAGFEPANKLSG